MRFEDIFELAIKILVFLMEGFILVSRYLLVPLYLGLSWMVVIITLDFYKYLLGYVGSDVLSEQVIRSLELLDMTMVANLIWFIAAGSYYVFVHPVEAANQIDIEMRPRGLAHITSSALKEKMAGSLIGVSSVHLLQVFLDLTTQSTVDYGKLTVMIIIHMAFIAGLLAFNKTSSAEH